MIPNALSLLRILLTYIHISLMHFNVLSPLVSALFPIVATLTDGIDGIVARRFNMKSRLGEILDVTADRILEVSYWIFFATTGAIPFWVPLVIVSRGLITDSLVGYSRLRGLTRLSLTDKGVYWFIAASRFSRGAYGLLKLATFSLLSYGVDVLPLVYASVAYCIIRGIPVAHNSLKLIVKESHGNLDLKNSLTPGNLSRGSK